MGFTSLNVEQLGVSAIAIGILLLWVKSCLSENKTLREENKQLRAEGTKDKEYERRRSQSQQETLHRLTDSNNSLETAFRALTEVLRL